MFGQLITRLIILGICLAAGCGDAARPNSAESSMLNYAAWAYDGEGLALIDDQLRGMILMRDVSTMTSVGDSYFDDGLGNLLVHGSFMSAASTNEGDYALTFLKGGGVQLALDFENDRVVDVVFDITPEGHFGVIGDLALESEIDCIARRMIDGEDPLSAVDACLGPRRNPSGVAGGSAIAGPTGNEYDRLAEPDCGSTGASGVLTMVAESPGNEWKQLPTWGPLPSDEYSVSGTSYVRPNDAPGAPADSIDSVRMEHNETGDVIRISTETTHDASGTPTVTTTRQDTEYLSNGETRETETVHVNGRKVSSSSSYYDTNTGECLRGSCKDDESDAPDGNDSNTAGDEGTSNDSSSGAESAGQPGPGCEIEGDCPFTDPRCAGPNNDLEALWDCVARTGSSPMDCLARLNDAVYATTGCMTVLGPSGQPELQCPGSDADEVADCLSSGGSPDGCLGQGGGSVNENDDLLGTFSHIGSSDIDYLDYSGIGAVFFGFCNEGVEQLCGGGPQF